MLSPARGEGPGEGCPSLTPNAQGTHSAGGRTGRVANIAYAATMWFESSRPEAANLRANLAEAGKNRSRVRLQSHPSEGKPA
jgi:hypothetical protein